VITCQQSSKFKYLYPFSAKPVLTNRSAVYSIIFYEILQAKWFHEFHPIGGVNPSPLSSAEIEYIRTSTKVILKSTFIGMYLIINPKCKEKFILKMRIYCY
jgi:hypothetical protein